MKISNPELKVVRFGADDVIATSGLIGALTGTKGSFYIPAGQYTGGSYSGNYVEFNGTFGNYNGSEYEITGISGAKGGIDGERDEMKSGEDVVFGGVTIPGVPTMESFAKQYYDAYSYGGGTYYSNGTSYYEMYWQ